MIKQLTRLLTDIQTILVLQVSNLTLSRIIIRFPLTWQIVLTLKKIISKLSLTTATGSDGVPPKLVKLANKVISRPLLELINETLIHHKRHFPNAEKIACVAPVFKKDDRWLDKSNYRSRKCIKRFL